MQAWAVLQNIVSLPSTCSIGRESLCVKGAWTAYTPPESTTKHEHVTFVKPIILLVTKTDSDVYVRINLAPQMESKL